MRIIAIDPSTGTEVITICPVNYPVPLMKRLAYRKLCYVLEKKKAEAAEKAEKDKKGWIA